MWRRSAAGLLGVLLPGVLMLGAVPAAPAVAPAVATDGYPPGWLELDAGPTGQVHRLTPGGSADWVVDVQVRGEPASSLKVGMEPGPADAEALRDFLSVELQGCSEPWTGSSCAQGPRVLMKRTPLNRADGVRVDLMSPGALESTHAHVLVRATLAEDVPPEVRGSRTQMVLGFHGSGGGAGSGDGAGSGGSPGNPAEPPSDALAHTGFRLGGFALLGSVAVMAGFGLARLRGGGR
ncbi:hypothetical protein J2790_003022 [Paenarthrobacter nicotinovorans]|uniref:hypothetical protein n=1 Tax=Micrococcaceae TaxID=1268 RepID=UPI00087746AC|nr:MULTISPECIES: hypothetical protein [Micrococcaceae]MDR6437873.1 hypothetical protein [Paenarthrobacter nicotinovorans]SCZ64707.1 hypothetical protein SAMN02799638_03938 [Arthrobacter sp. UNCCL28]